MLLDIVIFSGTLVTPRGMIEADLGIAGETIAAIGQPAPWPVDQPVLAKPGDRLAPPRGPGGLAGREIIDAAGKLVIPGGIDPHVHLEMPAGAA